MEDVMQASDWLNALSNAGPWIVAVTAIVMWGIRGMFAKGDDENRRQTELLERIAAQRDKSKP
jgi:hypothetical protein